MKAIRRIGLALLPLLLLIVCWMVSRSNPEPEYQGKPVSYWMMGTRSYDLSLDRNRWLAEMGTNAVPQLVKALRTRPTWFANLLEKAAPKVPSGLRKHLPSVRTRYEISLIRGKAIYALQALGYDAASALPALYAVFQDGSPDIQSRALTATYLIGPTQEAIPALVAIWHNTNRLHPANRSEVIMNLGKVGHLDPRAVVPVLVQALDDSDAAVRRNAPFILGKIGYPAPAAVPKLMSLLEDSEGRAGAAYALGRVTNSYEPAIPHLRRLTQDSEPEVRACAALTIWRFTQESGPALQVLSNIVWMADQNREIIANCLGEMGPNAKEAIPLLRGIALSRENYNMAQYHRVCAADAILRVDPSESDAIDVLVESLHYPSPWVRRQTAMKLGHLGSVVKLATPALEKAMHDEDREVRHYSALALRQINSALEPGGNGRHR